ncbi:MAG: PHP domain-containing protein [Bacillota bacterium]|jgi:putative hydrolase
MNRWELFADWHTHTIYSDGKGSIADNLRAASQAGLEQVAITDHAPNNLGVGIKDMEQTLAEMRAEIDRCNRQHRKTKTLLGLEANVIDHEGKLDVPEYLRSSLDLLAVSLHPLVRPGNVWDGVRMFAPNLLQRATQLRSRRLRNLNTKAMVEAVQRHQVSFVAHPGLWIDIDTAELARVCASRDTAMEINCAHADRLAGYVQAALPSGVDFVINSDAHTPEEVGKLEAGIKLAQRLCLDPERIRNAKVRK